MLQKRADKPCQKRFARLAVFGGSFSPPHNAHVLAAEAFMRETQADALFVIPSGVHPCKREQERVSARDRFEMCRLAFENDERFGGKCTVSDIELLEGEVSYTYLTLEKLGCVADEIFMLVGADVLCGIERWKNFREVLERATVCCVARGDDGVRATAERLKEAYGARVTVIDVDTPEVSSGDIRRAAMAGEPFSHLVCGAVHDYIVEHGFYGVKK